MPEVGRLLVLVGLAVVAIGVVLWLLPFAPPLGRLPGDIRIERPGFRLYFPLATCVLLSVVVTLVLWLVGRWR